MEIMIRQDCSGLNRPALEQLFAAAGLDGRADGRILKAFQHSQRVALAWRGRQLVGAARALSDEAYHAFIYDVAVLPELQGQGLGRRLMHDLLTRLPVWRVMLRADEDVQGFYRSLGFEPYDGVMARLTPDFFTGPS